MKEREKRKVEEEEEEEEGFERKRGVKHTHTHTQKEVDCCLEEWGSTVVHEQENSHSLAPGQTNGETKAGAGTGTRERPGSSAR